MLRCKKNKQIIIHNRELPEPIEEVRQWFSGVKYLISLDLISRNWHVVLEKNSRKYTVCLYFCIYGKNLQFKQLSFGLNTSVASFIKCLDMSLRPGEVGFITVYVDDILITSRTLNDHLKHIRYVLCKLKEGGLTVNWDKSKVCKKERKFLGYIISPVGMRTDPNKLEAIQKFPETKNLKQLQSFLRLCNFYRRFQ